MADGIKNTRNITSLLITIVEREWYSAGKDTTSLRLLVALPL